MTIKLNRIKLTEKHRNALLASSNGQMTKEGVETLCNTVETLMNAKVREAAAKINLETSSKYKRIAKNALKIHAEKRDSQIKKYVNYVVENWVKKNDKQLTESIKNKQNTYIVEAIVNAMKSVHVKVPGTDAQKVLGKLAAKTEGLQKQVVSASSAVKAEKAKVEQLKKLVVIERLSRDLTDTQREKFSKLALSISAKTIKKFAESAKILKTSILKRPIKSEVSQSGKVVAESAVARAARI